MVDVDKVGVEVVVAHNERATLRVGDVFLKVDADQTHIDVEVEAMALAPIPTPEVLWRKPPVLALAALSGTALGHLGEPSTASSGAWAAAGAAVLLALGFVGLMHCLIETTVGSAHRRAVGSIPGLRALGPLTAIAAAALLALAAAAPWLPGTAVVAALVKGIT